MLSNAYFLAKFRFDTAENELAKKFAKKIDNFANPSAALTDLGGGAEERGVPRSAGRRRGGRSAKFRQKQLLVFGCIDTDLLQVNMRFSAFKQIYKII